MTQPAKPNKNITAHGGFARLMRALAHNVPASLWHAGRTSNAIRNLRGKRH